MKQFLSNLLIVFALALCGFNAFQWVREAHLRAEIASLTKSGHEKEQNIRNLQATLKRSEGEVERLDGVKTELTESVKTNRLAVLDLTTQVEKLGKELEAQKTQVDAYKAAVETANQRIKKQNDDIRKQNEEMKQLGEERNQSVVKYNKLVEQFNDLVKQFTEYQNEVATANAAPPAKGK